MPAGPPIFHIWLLTFSVNGAKVVWVVPFWYMASTAELATAVFAGRTE